MSDMSDFERAYQRKYGDKIFTHAPDSAARIAEQDAEIARLQKELEEARKDADEQAHLFCAAVEKIINGKGVFEMSENERLVATDLWVLQAQETIRTQQATIDRLTEQRDRLLAMIKDEEEHVYDSTCPYCGGRDYHHDKHTGGCHHSRRLALIAEIEAGNGK